MGVVNIISETCHLGVIWGLNTVTKVVSDVMLFIVMLIYTLIFAKLIFRGRSSGGGGGGVEGACPPFQSLKL